MDGFCPQQFNLHGRAREWKARFHAEIVARPPRNPRYISARRGFLLLGICNTPVCLLLETISLRTRCCKLESWEKWQTSTILGSLMGNLFSKLGLKDYSIERDVRRAVIPWLERLALSPRSLSSGKIWTLATSAFAQKDFAHWRSNTLGLWMVSNACAMVPGMDWTGVLNISMLSALAGNLVQLIEWHFRPPMHTYQFALGASRIVCAFEAVATLGWLQALYYRQVGLGSLGSLDGGVLACSFISQVDRDWTGLSTSWESRESIFALPKTTVGHSAHLAGAVVGTIYYLVFLRSQGAAVAAYEENVQNVEGKHNDVVAFDGISG